MYLTRNKTYCRKCSFCGSAMLPIKKIRDGFAKDLDLYLYGCLSCKMEFEKTLPTKGGIRV